VTAGGGRTPEVLEALDAAEWLATVARGASVLPGCVSSSERGQTDAGEALVAVSWAPGVAAERHAGAAEAEEAAAGGA